MEIIIGFVAVFAIIIAAVILYFVGIYNRFIKQANLYEEAWSGVTVQLKRRYDLIPNIVETVKGYAKHEQETLNQIVEKRNLAMNANGLVDKAAAENSLTQSLKTVFALSESYPELKANQNFIQLQDSLVSIEDDLQNARRYYNATVRDYNTAVDSFPSNIVASKYGFTKKDFFETSDAEKENVKVSF